MAQIKKNECNFIDIARVIGIFLVIFGHCNFYNPLLSQMLYLFHMPLFVIISGILHKDKELSLKNVKALVYNLIIPFLIYNAISIILLLFKNGLGDFHKEITIDVLLGLKYLNIPTWFFLSLFFIKLISLYLKHINQYILISISIIVIFLVLKYLDFDFFKYNYYAIWGSLFLFPFYTIGILLKKIIYQTNFKILKCIVIIVSFILSYFMAKAGMHLSVGGIEISNVLLNITIAVLDSFSILLIAQFLSLFIKSNIIKEISRGTMLIVGLHLAFFHQFLYPLQSIASASIKSLLILIFFYFFIKLTYNRLPILYGKK